MSESADSKQQTVKTSDVARLMELFQSSLLKYWEFQPVLSFQKVYSTGSSSSRTRTQGRRQDSSDSSGTRVDDFASVRSRRWTFWGKKKTASRDEAVERNSEETKAEKENVKAKHVKKMPV